ncbi:MAG: PAS domain-containing sensor histidine kinase [Pseudomonadota bacterium]
MNRSTRSGDRPPAGGELSDHFRTIAELSGDVAWIIDCRTGLLSFISDSVEDLLGYGHAEFHQALSGTDREAPLALLCAGIEERLRRFAEGDQSRQQLRRELEQRHRDGRLIPLEIVSAIVAGPDGAPSAVVGHIRDLRPQRALVAEQRRFASMINHEFRTPLSTIDGAIQRLEVTGAHADAPTRQRYRNISGAVDRLIGMLDTYLSPERMEAIGRVRQPDAVAPHKLLEEGAVQARAAGRLVSVDSGDLPPALRCEPSGLRLALKVLVANAIQYSPSHTVIALSGRRADGGIELLVRDEGPGVPPGECATIFGKHVRGSNADGMPGSGLGLYMARSVVEVHGGSLEMRNVEPRGAEFRIWLPAQGGAGKSIASEGNSSDNSS